jgi:hypothetical protein
MSLWLGRNGMRHALDRARATGQRRTTPQGPAAWRPAMPRQQMSERVDTKRRRMTDKTDRSGRRSARQTAVRRIEIGEAQAKAAKRTVQKMGSVEGSAARDSRTGNSKLNLATKRGATESGASKPSAARAASQTKRDTRKTGGSGKAAAARKPRASGTGGSRQPGTKTSATATRPVPPRTASGTKRRASKPG